MSEKGRGAMVKGDKEAKKEGDWENHQKGVSILSKNWGSSEKGRE